MGDSSRTFGAGVVGGDVLFAERHLATGRAASACEHLDQLALAVALDARDAKNLSLAQLE